MKFKLFLALFLIAIGTFVYFGYPVIKERYFNVEPKTIEIQNEPVEQGITSENINTQINNVTEEIESSSLKITVSPSDCDNECSKFEKNDEFEYCKEICGLSNADTENAESKTSVNCTNANGLQKDYCLKDLAIQNKDFKACDQINDSGVKKACKNRVTEDIMESQKL